MIATLNSFLGFDKLSLNGLDGDRCFSSEPASPPRARACCVSVRPIRTAGSKHGAFKGKARSALAKTCLSVSELFLRPLEASTADAHREAGRSSGRMDTQRDLVQVQTSNRFDHRVWQQIIVINRCPRLEFPSAIYANDDIDIPPRADDLRHAIALGAGDDVAAFALNL